MNNSQNNHRNILLSAVAVIGDLMICIALYCFFCKTSGFIYESGFMQTVVTVSAIYFSCIINGGVILYKRNVKDFQIPLLVLRNVIVFSIASTILLNIGKFHVLPWDLSLYFLLSLWGLSSLYRLSVRNLVKLYRIQERHCHHVVLVGSTANNIALYKEMADVPSFGYKVDGYFDYKKNEEFPAECAYLGKPEDVIPYLDKHNEIHELYCCLPSKNKNDILPIIHYCINQVIHFYSVPNVSNYLHHKMYLNMIGNIPYLSLYRDPLEKIENRMLKRAFDVVFSLLFLCTLFPVIFVIVAAITKLTMPGPVFFRQKRNGINGKEFYCIKFRSMRVNANADKVQATKDDPRKTKWGNIMRKTNIDELPQFINVLSGDMSIVGPRPHMLKHTEEYSKLIDKYMVRHFVKPGITGWSQVTGFRGETKELSQMEGRIKGDIWYIEHWSPWLDLYIIYKTIANVICGDDKAY